MSSKQLESILKGATSATPLRRISAEPLTIVATPEPEPKVEAVIASSPGREKQKPVSAYLPASVVQAMRVRGAAEGLTTRAMLLMGLRSIGFDIADEEIRDRRK